jgi:hypothetical protein
MKKYLVRNEDEVYYQTALGLRGAEGQTRKQFFFEKRTKKLLILLG